MRDLPTDDEFRDAVDSKDILNLVIRAHGEIDIAIRIAVAEALAEPHEVELERLTFPLKVDFAIALGVIHSRIRPLLLKLNRVRNSFAHDSRANVSESDRMEVLGTLAPELRQGVEKHIQNANGTKEILRIAFVIGFFECKGAVERVRERKRRQKIWMQDVESFLEETDKSNSLGTAGREPRNHALERPGEQE